jgi:hypothetical protein
MKTVYKSPPHKLAREGTMGMAMGIENLIDLPPQNWSKLNERISVLLRLCRPTWGILMSKKRHTPEQIISKLREAEVLLSQRQSAPVAWKRIEI